MAFESYNLKFAQYISQIDVHCASDSQQHVHGGDSVAALNLPHIDRIDADFFSQLFLGQTGCFSVCANALA